MERRIWRQARACAQRRRLLLAPWSAGRHFWSQHPNNRFPELITAILMAYLSSLIGPSGRMHEDAKGGNGSLWWHGHAHAATGHGWFHPGRFLSFIQF